jgi:hypothetical protein
MIRSFIGLLGALSLLACQPVEDGVPDHTSVNSFEHQRQSSHVYRANSDIANEFMDYMFRDELGGETQYFSRFDGPITVRFVQPAPPLATRDLKRLVHRLRNEAGIDIRVGDIDADVNIYIHRMPTAKVQNIARNAACLVVPNARDVKQFRAGWRSGDTQWKNVKSRDVVSVFLPSDQSPQTERDCMHEEIAQALGPLNDLFRVPNTVFNDDNMHRVLTPYDMLILRMVYDPKLRVGMGAQQVRAQLNGILARLNPKGAGVPKTAQSISLPWNALIRVGVNPRKSDQHRIQGAWRAIHYGADNKLGQPRLAYAILSHARASLGTDPQARVNEYQHVLGTYSQNFGADSVQVGQVSIELAFLLFQLGLIPEAASLIPTVKTAAKRYQNAEMMFEALHLQALVAHNSGEIAQYKALVAQAHGWGLYAFGNSAKVARIEHQIGQLRKTQE